MERREQYSNGIVIIENQDDLGGYNTEIATGQVEIEVHPQTNGDTWGRYATKAEAEAKAEELFQSGRAYRL